MDKVTSFIRQGDGRFLLLKLAKVSHLYRNINQTAERVRNGDIVLDLSSMEKVKHPFLLPLLTASPNPFSYVLTPYTILTPPLHFLWTPYSSDAWSLSLVTLFLLHFPTEPQRPYLSNDREFVAAAIQRIIQWRMYFRDLGHWPIPLVARRDRWVTPLQPNTNYIYPLGFLTVVLHFLSSSLFFCCCMNNSAPSLFWSWLMSWWCSMMSQIHVRTLETSLGSRILYIAFFGGR